MAFFDNTTMGLLYTTVFIASRTSNCTNFRCFRSFCNGDTSIKINNKFSLGLHFSWCLPVSSFFFAFCRLLWKWLFVAIHCRTRCRLDALRVKYKIRESFKKTFSQHSSHCSERALRLHHENTRRIEAASIGRAQQRYDWSYSFHVRCAFDKESVWRTIFRSRFRLLDVYRSGI